MTPDWLFKFLNFWLLGLVLAPSINSHLLTFFVMTNFGPYFILGACLSQIIDKKSLKKYVVSTFISFVLSGRELIYRIDGYSMHHKHVVKESIFLSIVVAVVVSANYKQVFSRNLFVTKIIRRLSLMTYPIYLLHEVIGLSVITLLIHAGMGHFISYIIVFVFIMFLSWLLTRYLEPKFNSIIRRYYLD